MDELATLRLMSIAVRFRKCEGEWRVKVFLGGAFRGGDEEDEAKKEGQ
jgi:hypothetical protein